MGRYCRVCGRHRPHEQFGGRGQRAIVCRKCRRLPREQRMRALWMDEIYGFLEQSNISKKNLRRLGQLETEEIADVASLAALVRQIAEVHPRKRKRWKRLRQQHRGLFRRAVDAGVIDFIDPLASGRDELDEFPAVQDADWGVWIEPLPYEFEPTAEELRIAVADNDIAL